ncbi:MAG: penicillin-binding protein 2 [Candidatus Omnitrophica bacterium]|nr:penicillin-binding protein 2 [Candidatus Omnitrophota bacterium]
MLGILGAGLFHTQVVRGRYFHELSKRNHVRLIPLEAPRGRVFDCRGRLLATNRASYNVVAIPEDVTPEVYPLLARLLKISESELRQRMSAGREYPLAPAVIKADVTRELAYRIEERQPELPGVSIRVDGIRYYPYEETASHVIGYIGAINQDEYQSLDRDRYGLNSMIGRSGIEKVFDERLRGWRGGEQIEVNARGQMIRVLSQREPEPGEDIRLTLDLEFQKRIMGLVKGQRASIAVLDLETEGLVAMASAPAYDPNIFVSPATSEQRLSILKDQSAPLLDRGVNAAYPPGSVFKLVTALAALDLGKITPETRFNCKGSLRLNARSKPVHCWFRAGHGSLNLYEGLERSCNVYFFNVAKRLSPDDIARYAHLLGLGEPMRLEVGRLAPGFIPDASWKKARFHQPWYQGETLNMAIGQGYLLVTPLEILRLTAIIAKDGRVVDPHLVASEGSFPQERPRVAIKEQHLKVIKQAMLQVVQSDYGTGQLARVDFEKLAGKTGTAQTPPKKAHSWMTGFFPYKEPKLAFVVFVEHGGSGGITSARLVKQMLESWKELYASPLA